MPALGMAQDTGKVLQWLKHGGEVVAEGEPLVEVETDKATLEIEAPASGTLAEVSTPEGAEVAVGTVIAVVLAPGESAVPEPEDADSSAVAGPPDGPDESHAADSPDARAPSDPAPGVEVADPAAPVEVADPAAPELAGGSDVADLVAAPVRRQSRRASPKARRLARARGVDLHAVAGSGPSGAVLASDVEQVAGQAGEAARFQVGSVWRVMAERTQRSWQDVPQFVLWRQIDASRLASWKGAARRKPGSEAVTHTDLLVKVCAEALRRHPRVNASWLDGAIVPGDGINVAFAVAIENGLVAPVLHHADRLELAAISARRRELTEAARARRLRPADLEGGTFTISNLGMYGVDGFQAIVDAPQAAILAVGRVTEQPVALNGDVLVRPVLALSVSFDHRVVDGARGAEFLDTLASLVEEPAGLLA
jgi:pyruvate dehydrogenase E2 component (dihydrolipoamide acetyltransferase)